jgi:hypothetical protein
VFLAHRVTQARKDLGIFSFDSFRDLREAFMAHYVPLMHRQHFQPKKGIA